MIPTHPRRPRPGHIGFVWAATATLVALSFLPAPVTASPRRGVVPFLEAISVTVSVPGHWGSGTLIQRDGATYCLTAGHVAEELRDGAKWREAELFDTEVRDGVARNHSLGKARLLRISDSDKGDDLALLRLEKATDGPGARFFLSDHIPGVGTPLLHVRSFLGIDFSNSFSMGVVSQVGRDLGLPSHVLFDQMTAPSFPGSSGGGVFLEDGRYVGMLLRGADSALGLYAPIRRIRAWAHRQGLDFAVDPAAAVPGDLDGHAVEDGEGG